MACTACNNNSDQHQHSTPEVTTMLPPQTPAAGVTKSGDTTVVVINGNDDMTFDLNDITVQAGKPVRLTLHNIGKLPAQSMAHNWVLLVQGTSLGAFAQAALEDKSGEYIPPAKEKIIAHTRMLGPGEEHTINFVAPAKGEYDYLCTFPGHYAVMKGKLKSE